MGLPSGCVARASTFEDFKSTSSQVSESVRRTPSREYRLTIETLQAGYDPGKISSSSCSRLGGEKLFTFSYCYLLMKQMRVSVYGLLWGSS
ncbi:hypothetical protein AVEN_107425-1 [Araneus ventricosus]|uniref:Uncharacterized protein n=1 Tax=Araneus ventricosus TaxID=182803 RepID=A0A4Y2W2Q5_ARAVE|nr:hypothetical protein AVEN_107425-1 [Araneus ventricosus]